MVYGETNSGKTTSIIRTAPNPILYISAEGDAMKGVAVARAYNESVDIDVVEPLSQEDLMKSLGEMADEIISNRESFKYKTIVFDSGTYWMNCKLSIRVEDDRNKDRKGLDQGKLSAMTRTDWTEVGTVNSMMCRLTNLLKSIAGSGVMVIMTAQVQYDPKWNSELEAAPAFKYKEFNSALKGYFDYIGYTITKTEVVDVEKNQIKVIYPPLLSFSAKQGYLVKWRGVQPKSLIGSFNLRKIFKWYADRVEVGQ
jgi:hypothetical protein